MAWYDVGTVYVTNGTTAVSGTGTDFTVGARVGDGIKMPDGVIYEIAAIGNATSLTLGENYNGTTVSAPGSSYSIIQTQNLTSTLAGQVSTLINDYQTGLDSISGGIFQAANGSVTAPSLTFASDLNTGIYSIAADQLGVAASGVQGVKVTSTAVTLNNAGSAKLATTSTGIDVTGTVVADGLTVTTGSPTGTLASLKGSSGFGFTFSSDASVPYVQSISVGTSEEIAIVSGGNRLALFQDGGDISFYEDTGTTAKFYWDASAESLGIGTTTPIKPLTLASADTATISGMALNHGASNYWGVGSYTDQSFRIAKSHGLEDVNTYFTIARSSGNVGIGTSSPSQLLHIYEDTAATGAFARMEEVGGQVAFFGVNTTGGSIQVSGANPLQIATNGTERMRIDSSGNLLVGKTLANTATTGIQLLPNGSSALTRASGVPLYIARNTTDGDIAVFQKDGAPVGSIASRAGVVTSVVLDPRTNGSGITGGTNSIYPTNQTGNPTDATVILGSATDRFKDLYLSGGVYLGGTVAANHLDDYEEGSFTPVVVGLTTTGSGTYTVQQGLYTKVGRLVEIEIVLVVDTHTGTGNVQINGLPFASNSISHMTTVSYSMAYTTGYQLTSSTGSSTSYLRLYGHKENAGFIDVQVDGSCGIRITGTYITA